VQATALEANSVDWGEGDGADMARPLMHICLSASLSAIPSVRSASSTSLICTALVFSDWHSVDPPCRC
jgi:hypothetical protein